MAVTTFASALASRSVVTKSNGSVVTVLLPASVAAVTAVRSVPFAAEVTARITISAAVSIAAAVPVEETSLLLVVVTQLGKI